MGTQSQVLVIATGAAHLDIRSKSSPSMIGRVWFEKLFCSSQVLAPPGLEIFVPAQYSGLFPVCVTLALTCAQKASLVCWKQTASRQDDVSL